MPRFNNDGRTSKFLHMAGGGGSKKFDHDDRNRFKFTINRGGIHRKGKGGAFARLDATGDTVMDPSEPGTSRAYIQQGGKRNRKAGWRNNQNQQNDSRNSRDAHTFGATWHKITIYNGKAYEKSFILTSLGQICRLPFVPICYTVLGTNAVFHVEQRDIAEALSECNSKISCPTGQKVNLRVNSCGTPPTASIDDDCEAHIKAELDRRFNTASMTLSLANFYMSPALVNDYFLPLYRPSVVEKLTKLLTPHLNNIIGLDLSNNKLPALDNLSKIINKATSLRALSLKDNKIREFHTLDRLQAPTIIELILEGNPICDTVSDKEAYISSVRKRFPKVIKLDGADLAAPLSFDVSEPSHFPDVRGSSFCNDQAKAVVIRFWELYVQIFDSDNRQSLLEAYHDSASMSMVAAYNRDGHVSQVESSKKLSHYIQDSRNLKQHTERSKRIKLLQQGKLDIVSFLTKLPKSLHDPNSFVMDMPVAVENFILFTVTGIFKERMERSTPYRYFSRTFTLVPQNAGFVIINELLFITNPTNDQIKAAFRQPAPTPSPSPVPQIQPVPQTAVVPAVPLTEDQQRQMFTLFAQQSGMNELFARRCLEENAWDFEKSARVFTELKAQNKIPPEAFVK